MNDVGCSRWVLVDRVGRRLASGTRLNKPVKIQILFIYILGSLHILTRSHLSVFHARSQNYKKLRSLK